LQGLQAQLLLWLCSRQPSPLKQLWVAKQCWAQHHSLQVSLVWELTLTNNNASQLLKVRHSLHKLHYSTQEQHQLLPGMHCHPPHMPGPGPRASLALLVYWKSSATKAVHQPVVQLLAWARLVRQQTR
jgi:hypothetical protein